MTGRGLAEEGASIAAGYWRAERGPLTPRTSPSSIKSAVRVNVG
jgi:hypothetical protein